MLWLLISRLIRGQTFVNESVSHDEPGVTAGLARTMTALGFPQVQEMQHSLNVTTPRVLPQCGAVVFCWEFAKVKFWVNWFHHRNLLAVFWPLQLLSCLHLKALKVAKGTCFLLSSQPDKKVIRKPIQGVLRLTKFEFEGEISGISASEYSRSSLKHTEEDKLITHLPIELCWGCTVQNLPKLTGNI